MHRNKGGATTFDCYWKSNLESWVRTILYATKLHLLYVVMYKNDIQRARTMQGTMQTPIMTLVHGISYRCLESNIENAILFRKFGFIALKIV